MAKSKSKSKSKSQARVQAKIQERTQRDNALIALLAFCIVAVSVIVVNVTVMNLSVVPVCLLMILEVGIAVLLHHAELWIHGVLLLAEVIAGIVMGKVVPVLLFAAVYVMATIALKYLNIGEK